MSGMAATCPRCGAPVPDEGVDPSGMLTCACGYRGYAGYLREYEYLSSRRQWLWDRITEQSGPPSPDIIRQYGIWPAGRPPAQRGATRGGSVQVLLVALGAGLLILAGLVFVAVAWEIIGPFGQLTFLLLTTAACAAVAVLIRRRTPRTAEALAVVAYALAAIVVTAAPALGVIPEDWTRASAPYWLIVTAGLMLAALAAGRWSGLQAWVWTGWLTSPLAVAAGLGLLFGPVDGEQVQVTIAALAYLLLGAGLIAGLPGQRLPMAVAGGVGLVVAAGLALALLAFSPPVGAIVTIAAALLCLILLHGRFPTEYLGWPLFGVWLALWAMLPPATVWTSAAVGLVGAALLLALGRHRPGVATVSAWTLWITWMFTGDARIWLVLAIAGAALFLLALRVPAAPVAWLGAVSLQTALLLQWQDPPFVEAPTLAFAGLLLVAGLLQLRAGQDHSFVIYAPATAMALIPTSLLVWDEIWARESLVRFTIVMAVGVAILLVGVHLRLLGLIVPAAVAVSIAATAQIYAGLDLLPRWLALAVAGAGLIAVGARIEWVRSKRAEAAEWLQSLN